MNSNEIQLYIEKRLRETGIDVPTLEELNEFLTEFMQIKNSHPLDYFEGYSPSQMQSVLNNLFSEDCPVQFNNFTNEDCDSVPLFRQAKVLLNLIEKEGSIKLTQTGNLPIRIVKEMYAAGACEPYIESGLINLRSENDSISVQMARIAVELLRVVKKQHNKLSLTKNGKKLLANDRNLLVELLTVMFNRFNLAYFDGHSSNNIGILGIGFTLILLCKYGETERLSTFYSDKYLNAFPLLLEEVTENYGSIETNASSCYVHRSFKILLYRLGLVSIRQRVKWPDEKTLIQKTRLFDQLLLVRPA